MFYSVDRPVGDVRRSMGDALPASIKHEMLEQLAEQSKRGAIKDLQTKSGMLASLLVVASFQLWTGSIALATGPACAAHLHWWLACDGAATSVGMLLGLAVLTKGVQIARRVEARHWLRADGKDRDASGDLTGVWRTARQLSDGMDCVLVASFVWGCYCLGAAGESGDACDGTGRSAVLRGLVLKPLAPTGVSVAVKGWSMLRGGSHAVPPRAIQMATRRKRE